MQLCVKHPALEEMLSSTTAFYFPSALHCVKGNRNHTRLSPVTRRTLNASINRPRPSVLLVAGRNTPFDARVRIRDWSFDHGTWGSGNRPTFTQSEKFPSLIWKPTDGFRMYSSHALDSRDVLDALWEQCVFLLLHCKPYRWEDGAISEKLVPAAPSTIFKRLVSQWN